MDTLLANTIPYLLTIWGVVTLVFLVAVIRADNSLMDIAYGPTFAIAAWSIVLFSQTTEPLPFVVAGCISLWALRLSVRIGRKNWGRPEDARYAAWRSAWQARSHPYFILRSYGQIYLLQGFIIAIVGLPALLAVSFANSLSLPLLLIGTFIFASGLAYETIADTQLDTFLRKKRAGETTEDLMQTGLFRYSRRPNYFGEVTIWVGLAITVLSTPLGWLALLSPLTIWYIVSHVTGPMLEQIFLDKFPEQYQAYIDRTNYLLPGPPRSP